MGMFLNYQDIAANYTPNNLYKKFPQYSNASKLQPLDITKPYEEYDIKGNLIGYYWYYGNTINLDFTIDGEITVESDALILSNKGEYPDQTTVGKLRQKCYNIVDFISWTCTGIIDNSYIWTQDSEFTYPEYSDRPVYVSSEDYLKDKKILVTIYNFRHEPIVDKLFEGSPNIVFTIDKELSQLLIKNVYYCSLTVFNDDTNITIFSIEDCKLVVK